MEAIESIRQMMAEQKFFEAQKQIEVQLSLNVEDRFVLLKLYFETLDQQKKIIPNHLLIELAESESQKKNHEEALSYIELVTSREFDSKILKIKISAAADKGMLQEVYELVSTFYLTQFESQTPYIPEWIAEIVHKYFKQDFNLQLKHLAIVLSVNDLVQAEEILKELITTSVEKSSPKGIAQKLEAIAEVLKGSSNKAQLEIYQNFCLISAHGLKEKSELKRIIEMIIYFEDFRFQTLVLNLLHQLNLTDEAADYASVIKSNADYSYVYFDKYFSHLKPYFFKVSKKAEPKTAEPETPDLKLTTKYKSQVMPDFQIIETDEDEAQYLNFLKHQDFSPRELCDLAVSFLQSEMPKVSLRASEIAIKKSDTDEDFLKASYLKLSALLLLKDFRAAVDTCLSALEKSKTKDDVLSFLYGQAEAHIRLNQKREAKIILKKILQIDSGYRMTKERLEKLDEI